MKEKLILNFAKYLSEVHSHTLTPFYSKRASTFWQELENMTSKSEEVDKTFFILMAESIEKSLHSLDERVKSQELVNEPINHEDNKVLFLAQILADIHSANFAPFYEDSDTPFWDELEETTSNPKDVDKAFFKRIAKKILLELK